jgi:hypothetical protein
MQCFNHHDVPAVGMCKHCCKGLCAACAADLGFGLACHGEHEEQVRVVHAMLAKTARIHSVNQLGKYVSPAFFVVMGLLFLGFGLYQDGFVVGFTATMGAVFLLYGLFLLGVSRKVYARPKAQHQG